MGIGKLKTRTTINPNVSVAPTQSLKHTGLVTKAIQKAGNQALEFAHTLAKKRQIAKEDTEFYEGMSKFQGDLAEMQAQGRDLAHKAEAMDVYGESVAGEVDRLISEATKDMSSGAKRKFLQQGTTLGNSYKRQELSYQRKIQAFQAEQAIHNVIAQHAKTILEFPGDEDILELASASLTNQGIAAIGISLDAEQADALVKDGLKQFHDARINGLLHKVRGAGDASAKEKFYDTAEEAILKASLDDVLSSDEVMSRYNRLDRHKNSDRASANRVDRANKKELKASFETLEREANRQAAEWVSKGFPEKAFAIIDDLLEGSQIPNKSYHRIRTKLIKDKTNLDFSRFKSQIRTMLRDRVSFAKIQMFYDRNSIGLPAIKLLKVQERISDAKSDIVNTTAAMADKEFIIKNITDLDDSDEAQHQYNKLLQDGIKNDTAKKAVLKEHRDFAKDLHTTIGESVADLDLMVKDKAVFGRILAKLSKTYENSDNPLFNKKWDALKEYELMLEYRTYPDLIELNSNILQNRKVERELKRDKELQQGTR